MPMVYNKRVSGNRIARNASDPGEPAARNAEKSEYLSECLDKISKLELENSRLRNSGNSEVLEKLSEIIAGLKEIRTMLVGSDIGNTHLDVANNTEPEPSVKTAERVSEISSTDEPINAKLGKLRNILGKQGAF